MSAKTTILYHRQMDISYHFYWDKEKGKFKLDSSCDTAMQEFLDRVGNILEKCPMSDLMLDEGRKNYRPVCPIIENGRD